MCSLIVHNIYPSILVFYDLLPKISTGDSAVKFSEYSEYILVFYDLSPKISTGDSAVKFSEYSEHFYLMST